MPILQSSQMQKPTTVKVFMSGNSQAVRLPKEYRFDVDTLTIQKIGDSVVLTPTIPITNAWDNFQQALDEFDPNFSEFFANRKAENTLADSLETKKNMDLDTLFVE